jgi:(4S)-4-hydroxy-5-phosphonooxypentane-2,3-dione isomerase
MTFLARFRIKPDKVAEFAALTREAERVAASEPDTLAYKFYRLDEPGAFAVFESFTGPEADEAHQANPANVPIIARMIDCMEGTYTREYLHDV